MAGLDDFLDPTRTKWNAQDNPTPRSPSPLLPPASSYKKIGSDVTLDLSADPDSAPSTERLAGLGHGIIGIVAENLVSHPFIVIRRQCQVNNNSYRYHRTPFTLLPVFVNLNRTQGLSSLWKGLGSTLTVRGLTLAVEDLTSKLTPWPREIDRQCSLRMIGQHLLLKAVSISVLTPFYSASLVETVQSEIASEKPGMLDIFKEALNRIMSWRNPHSTGRMLPVWLLVWPTMFYGVAHYVTYMIAKGLSRTFLTRFYRQKQQSQGAVLKAGCTLPGMVQYHEQVSSLFGRFSADVLLFPIETVLNRIHLQGTRTIVDNLDSGREVMPIMTRYEGFFDCLASIQQEEDGFKGLFKGFGALIVQYAIQLALIRASAAIIREVSRIVNQNEIEAEELKKHLKEAEKINKKSPVVDKEDMVGASPVLERNPSANWRSLSRDSSTFMQQDRDLTEDSVDFGLTRQISASSSRPKSSQSFHKKFDL